jgi:hypothetical protein
MFNLGFISPRGAVGVAEMERWQELFAKYHSNLPVDEGWQFISVVLAT